MVNRTKFYIDGAWIDPSGNKTWAVINPATEEPMYEIAVGSKADVDKAVAAARRAFATFSRATRDDRVALLTRIAETYKKRAKDIATAISDEMGAPMGLAERAQAGAGLGHIMTTIDVLKSFTGDPKADTTTMGPVVNKVQWEKIQGLIKKGIDEGATLVTGGLGCPMA